MRYPKDHKTAFSMGYRGFDKMLYPKGLYPAPTLNQVRDLERSHQVTLWVKGGKLYYRNTGKIANLI